MKNQNNDTYSLAHTTWKCQYHIVFTPKYHRKIIYGALRAEIGKILRELCQRKEVEIIEAHAMPDHIHMLVSMPPNEKVSSFVGGKYCPTKYTPKTYVFGVYFTIYSGFKRSQWFLILTTDFLYV